MRNKFLLLTLSLFFSISSYAQDDFPNFQRFNVGIQLGASALGGDIFPKASPNIGVHGTIAISDRFALRSTFSMYQLKGINFYTGEVSNPISRTIQELGYNSFVYNHSTQLYDFSIEALRTVYYQNMDVYVGGTLGYHIYNVRYDATDKSGNLYDYTPLITSISARGDVSKEDYDIINNILDGEYETTQLVDRNFEANSSPSIGARAGINYSINSKFKIGLDARLLLSLQDNLDGFREASNILKNDQVMSLSIVGSYNL